MGVPGVIPLAVANCTTFLATAPTCNYLLCTQGVRGSNPLSSTTASKRDPALVAPNLSDPLHGPYSGPMISTLSEAISTYRVLAEAEGKSRRTIEWVENSVRYLDDFLGNDLVIEDITRQDVRRFISALQKRQKWADHPYTPAREFISPTTINTYVRGIKLLFSTLEREDFISPHEVTTIRAPKLPRKIIQPFSETQLKSIFKALETGPCAQRNRAIVWLLLDPGLRVSEVVSLKEEYVDLEERQVKVMGKGAKERLLPLAAQVTKALLAYKVKWRPEPAGSDRFFLSQDGRLLAFLKGRDKSPHILSGYVLDD